MIVGGEPFQELFRWQSAPVPAKGDADAQHCAGKGGGSGDGKYVYYTDRNQVYRLAASGDGNSGDNGVALAIGGLRTRRSRSLRCSGDSVIDTSPIRPGYARLTSSSQSSLK